MITVEGLEVGSSYLHIRCMSREYIRVKFVYEGHRVKVKVTEAKKVDNSYSCNVKNTSIAHKSGSRKDRAIKVACRVFGQGRKGGERT